MVAVTHNLLLLLCALLAGGEASATKCLQDRQVAISIDGGPSATTWQLLDALKKGNITVLFDIDSERLGWEGTPSIMQSMDRGGHLLGLSLNKGMRINDMSTEGFQGAVQKRVKDFNAAFGKVPVFLKVPQDTTAEKIGQLQTAGFLIVSPGLDLTGVATGNCEATFNTTMPKSALGASSGLVALPDTEGGCAVDEIAKIASYAKASGLNIVRMDKCINLEIPYRSNSVQDPINFTFMDFSSPKTSTVDPLNAQATSDASSLHTGLLGSLLVTVATLLMLLV